MSGHAVARRHLAQPLLGALLLASALALAACNHVPPGADRELMDQAGQWFSDVQQLRQLHVNNDEVKQLTLARQAGISDPNCMEMLSIARRRGQHFSDGEGAAALMRAGAQESTVMALARLEQLGNFAGEARAMKLAGLSDEIVLALARRRNAGQPVLSSAKAAQLRNVRLTNAQILDVVKSGTTDAQADAIIAQRHRAAGGTRFVPNRGTVRRRR